MDRRAVSLGILGSAAVLGYLLARGPAWDWVAVVLAALLPAGIVLYGGAARGRSSALRSGPGPDRARIPPFRGDHPEPRRPRRRVWPRTIRPGCSSSSARRAT